MLNVDGEDIQNIRIRVSVEFLNEFLDGFREAVFVLESTNVWEWYYQSIESVGFDVKKVNSVQV